MARAGVSSRAWAGIIAGVIAAAIVAFTLMQISSVQHEIRGRLMLPHQRAEAWRITQALLNDRYSEGPFHIDSVTVNERVIVWWDGPALSSADERAQSLAGEASQLVHGNLTVDVRRISPSERDR